jgi:hypothetical protein
MTRKISVLSGKERLGVFGSFAYQEMGGGRIRIDEQWVEQNIVSVTLQNANGRGKDIVTRCHKLAKSPLERAFAEIAQHKLSKLIHTFDGLWVPRHMTWNVRRPLSSHSWGIAFDLNAATNPYGGGVSIENRALNAIFNEYGFAWGGDWNGAKDGMHWELADVRAWEREKYQEPRLILALDRGKSFSYHAVPHATLQEGHFLVDAAAVAALMGSPAMTGPRASGMASLKPSGETSPKVEPKSPDESPERQPIESVLGQLKLKIIKRGDHLRDVSDPRYYLFLRTLSSSGQRQ